MKKLDDRETLRQIIEYVDRARALCAGKTAEQIEGDWTSALAFERVMEVLGEAVKRLPPELCARYPEVPWKAVAGMRDKISHGYDAVDYEILWDAVQKDLPTLRTTAERMLKDLKGSAKS